MDWITMPPSVIPKVLLSTAGIYVAVILFTRISGLRSFAKISSFDFAMTVAVGSLIATTITTDDPPLLQGIIALAGLYMMQILIAYLRTKGYAFISVVDNQPLLLMEGENVLKENLVEAKVTYADLLEKLREANVTEFSQVKAVVFETTGHISVLHNNKLPHQWDKGLIENVRGADTIKKI